jgi:multidrug efflux pump subunit AcrA (membrane-fusion protein)
MRRLWIFLPVFCTLFACGRSNPPSGTGQTVKNVLVTKALNQDVPVQLYEFGRISSPESVDVKPQVAGRITEVHFTDGQDT